MSNVRVNEERKKQDKIRLYCVQPVFLLIRRYGELNTQVQKEKRALFVTAPSENRHPGTFNLVLDYMEKSLPWTEGHLPSRVIFSAQRLSERTKS